MAVNQYFQSGLTPGRSSEHRLVEDLIIETIRTMGFNIFYIPRTVVKHDRIFGEDVLSQYTQAYPLEVYLQNVEGWNGEKDLFTKFGIQVKDKATFILAKRRWEDIIREQGKNLQLPNRPAEGDLIYFPLTDSLFEITFIKADEPFYQLGKHFVYTMECELFQYSSEKIETGIPEIDNDFKTLSFDTLSKDDPDAFEIEMADPLANNKDLQTEANNILDFTVLNPFGEI